MAINNNTTTDTNSVATANGTATTKHQLPVVIAGGGPCGLVTAVTLQKRGIPFVIYERASRERLCSNVGSGFDMAPTAIKIMQNHLSLGNHMDKKMQPYDNMWVADMTDQEEIRSLATRDMMPSNDPNVVYGMANRAELQRALLNVLFFEKEENSILQCGIAVTGYENQENHVMVSLSNGTNVRAAALLACDGIHSAVRKHMNRDKQDNLHHCGQKCWWGKTTIQPGSELDKELQKMNLNNGSTAIMLAGNHKTPGFFLSSPAVTGGSSCAWAYVAKEEEQQKSKKNKEQQPSDDLVRRGGVVLTEEMKCQELLEPMANHCKLLRLFIRATPASDITRVGLLDRENLDLPYTDGRVALLGDAAHPQSPMMGQGCNMAIVDGYVCATRLANALDNGNTSNDGVIGALADYDSNARRKGVNKVIHQARSYGNMFVSSGLITCWINKMVLRFTPSSILGAEIKAGDNSNKEFVEALNDVSHQSQ